MTHTRGSLAQGALRLVAGAAIASSAALPATVVAPAGSPLAPRPAHAASIVVTTLNWAFLTDGACSLAEAYANTVFNHNLFYPDCAAGSAVALDTIGFSVSGTILIGLGGFSHDVSHGPLAVDGAGQSVVLDAQNLGQIFYNVSGSLSVSNLTLTKSGTLGLANDGTLALDNVTISNSADTGLSNSGTGTATVNNSRITGATALGVQGGGVRNNGTMTITNSVISGNSAPGQWGGGVWNAGILSPSTLTISNTTVSNNTASIGAGIMSWPPSTLTVVDSTISGNVATGDGGGFHFQGGFDLATATNVTIRGATISGNSAANGGGLHMSSGVIPTTISNSTISGNTATTNGGGVNVNAGTLTLTNTTVAGNTALNGGGVRRQAGATVNLQNSLLGDNTATTGPECAGSVATGATPNHIENLAGCTITGAAPTTGAPGLGLLAANGGPTQTHALLAGSPARDTGNAALCAAAPISGLDQRGIVRPQGPACDLGAFEAAPPPVIGGKNFTITTGSIDLSWDTGTAQTAYTLLKYNTSTAAATLIPVGGAATSYSDTTALNGVVYCYVLAALNGPTFLGLSDLLCGMAGQETGTAIPRDFSLKLGQTATSTMTWAAPIGGADSYLLQRIPLDGSAITAVPLGGGVTTTAEAVVAAGTCFQLIAFKAAGFGTSDVLCGVPGVSTLRVASDGHPSSAVVLATALPRLTRALAEVWKPAATAEDSSLENR